MAGNVLQFPLRLGLSEDANPKAAPVSALKTGANIRWPKDGQIGKRWGSDLLPVALSGGGNLSGIRRFVLRGSELAVVANGARLHSYDSTNSQWLVGPRLSDAGLEWSTPLDSVEGLCTAESAILSNGTVVYVWVTGETTQETTGKLYYQICDLATGTLLTAPTLLAAAVWPRIRLVSSGTTWLVLAIASGGALKSYTFTNTAVTTTLQSNASDSMDHALDACVIGSDFVVAYTLLAGGIALYRYTLVNTPVAQANSTVTSETSTNIQAISIAGAAGETLYIAYFASDVNAIRRACANPSTMVQTVAPGDVETTSFMSTGTVGIVRSSSITALLVYSHTGSDFEAGIMRSVEIENSGALSPLQTTIFMHPLSRPFLRGDRFYMFAATDILAGSFIAEGTMPTSDTFLIDVTGDQYVTEPFREVGKLDTDVGGTFARGFVTNLSAESSTIGYATLPFQATLDAGRVGWRPGGSNVRMTSARQGARFVRVTTGDDVPPDMWRSVQLGPEAAIGGGVLQSYDSVDAIGYGWPHSPYIDPDFTAANSAGGNMANGSYIYNVTAERRSAVGLLHRSPFGIPVTRTVVGPTGSVEVGIVPASLGRSQTVPGHFPLYRSEANGSVLYRITVETSFMTTVDNGDGDYPVLVTDTSLSNAIGSGGTLNLAERPNPYIDTSELEDQQPPGVYTVHMHQRRLGVVTGGRREYWFSKDFNENPGIAPGFNSAQRELYDEELTAASSLDEKRIMFSERRIWFVVGDGPTVAGTDNRFSPPQQIQTDVGCTNPRSVVSTPLGVFFQNDVDLYLLTRGLTVEWIGKDVRDQLASYPNITSAVLVSSETEVRFTCNDEAGTAGIVLVFDYQRGTWMVRSYPSGAAIVDACVYSGAYHIATANTVRVESYETHLDDDEYAPSTVILSPISPSGPIAWHRVKRAQILGTSVSNHQLTIAVARDFSASTQQTKTFAAGSDTTTVGPLERAQVDLSVQKVQAVEIQISDAAPANANAYPLGNGAGFTLDGVALLVQPKRGLPRITPSRRG